MTTTPSSCTTAMLVNIHYQILRSTLMRTTPPRHPAVGRFVWFFLLGILPLAAEAPRDGIPLVEAVEVALSDNAELAAAAARITASQAGVREARSALLPDLTAIGEYTRSEEPNLVHPMHGTPTPQSPLEFDDEIYSGVVRLEVPILNLPAVSGVAASRHLVDLRHAERAAGVQRVIGAVTELFIASAQVRDTADLLDGRIGALERRLTELNTLAGAGRVPPSSVSEVEANLQSLRAERIQLESRRDELAYRLASLLGRDRAVVPAVPQFVDAPQIAEVSPGGAARGPAFQAAHARYLAAEAARTAARARFAPAVDGFALQSGRSGGDLDVEGEWSLGLTVTVPLLTGGERLARLTAADADLEAARSLRASARTTTLTESRLLAQRWERAAEREALLTSAADSQERSVRAMEDRFDEGRASLSDLLTAETTLLELRMHARSARYDRLLAYVAHAEVTGTLSVELITSLVTEEYR